MDERQREARLQTLTAELEAERRRRLAAEAEAVAARAASDELQLQVQRTGLDGPIRAQRLFRGGALVLLVLLVVAFGAATTVGIVYFRRVERQLAAELAQAQNQLRNLGLVRSEEQQRERVAQLELRGQIQRCEARRCPTCPACPAPEEKVDSVPPAKAPARAAARPRPPPTPIAKPEKREPPVDEAAVEALLRQAQNAAEQGQHARAMDLARQVIKLKSSHQHAIKILGVCACATRNRLSAKWAYDRLTGYQRTALTQVCRSYSIALE